jgi:hypothetical protein
VHSNVYRITFRALLPCHPAYHGASSDGNLGIRSFRPAQNVFRRPQSPEPAAERRAAKPKDVRPTVVFGGPAGIPQAMEMRWETRINIRKGNGAKSSGFEYAWRRQGAGIRSTNLSFRFRVKK